MRIFLATIAATFLLIAGLMPASATTAGQALVQKPSYGQANAMVEQAGWRRHRHYRGYRWGWRRHHHRRWWW